MKKGFFYFLFLFLFTNSLFASEFITFEGENSIGISKDLKHVPPDECYATNDPDLDVNACCGQTWGVASPPICFFVCSTWTEFGWKPWCCDGTVQPEPRVCKFYPDEDPDEPTDPPVDPTPTDPGDCAGTINDDGLCVPLLECNTVSDPDLDVAACCDTNYDVDSPDVCYFYCSRGDNRANTDWCCNGTLEPPYPGACHGPQDPPDEPTPTDPPDEPTPTDPPTDPPPSDCPGTVTEEGLCVPPTNCNTVSDPDIDVAACCNYRWDVHSPDICYAFCSRADDRNANAWCCDGTVYPPLPACDRSNLTQNGFDSMLKTLGIRI